MVRYACKRGALKQSLFEMSLVLGRNGFRGSSKLSVLTHQLEIVQEEPYICSKAVVPADGAAT